MQFPLQYCIKSTYNLQNSKRSCLGKKILFNVFFKYIHFVSLNHKND